MPVIGAIFTAIGTAIGAIASAIGSIIAGIASAIAGAISFIFSSIAGIISTIGGLIVSGIVKVFSAISGFFTEKIFSIGTSIISKISQIVYSIFTPIVNFFMRIKSIVLSIKNFVVQTFKPISELIYQIFETVYHYIDKIVSWVKPIIDKIRNIYIAIRNSVFGKILSKLKAIADFISFFHTLARVYDAVQKKKYAQAIFILAYHFDDELKENVKIIMETISSEISQVMSEVNAVFRMMKDDMRSIYDTSQAYERVFRDFARIFHVEVFEDIADAIHKYIDKNIENAIKYLDSVRDSILNKIFYVVNPFGEVLTSIYLWERQEKSYQALYSYLTGRAISERLLRPAWDLKFMLFRII